MVVSLLDVDKREPKLQSKQLKRSRTSKTVMALKPVVSSVRRMKNLSVA